jgi:uncharacterized C2H2 Zn-finger protein
LCDREKLEREKWAIETTMNMLKDCPESDRVHPEHKEFVRTMNWFTERLKEIDKELKTRQMEG